VVVVHDGATVEGEGVVLMDLVDLVAVLEEEGSARDAGSDSGLGKPSPP